MGPSDQDHPDPSDLESILGGMEVDEFRQSHSGQLERTEWVDEETGYECLAFLNPFAVWVGYVRVPDDHPWFGWAIWEPDEDAPLRIRITGHSDQIEELRVHGGVTFTGTPAGTEEGWWFGFDCGHAWDIMPGLDRHLDAVLPDWQKEWRHLIRKRADDPFRPTFKNIDYVKSECSDLARQLLHIAVSQNRSGE